jgi:hypothetical protein
MKVKIEFDLGNSAFADDFEFAIESILDLGKLTDLNGNVVGEVALSE